MKNHLLIFFFEFRGLEKVNSFGPRPLGYWGIELREYQRVNVLTDTVGWR
jgi:hypothetical protein